MDLDNRVIGERYILEKQLGKGGNGSVFLCFDKKLNKKWAVKEVYEEGDMERSMELKLLKTISCNVFPRIVDVIQEENHSFLIMDYVEGITLKEKMKKQILTEADVLPWAIAIAKGIQYLHEMNPTILYMDCKPDNIMLTWDGEIRLIDLGSVYVCRQSEAHNLQKNKICTRKIQKKRQINSELHKSEENNGDMVLKRQRISGTHYFASKEQKQGRFGEHLPDVRSDIYTFGMTLYYLLTGGKKEYRQNGKLTVRIVNPAISWGMNHIIEKCTMEDSKHRYQSMEEVISQLMNIKEVGRWSKGKQRYLQCLQLLIKGGCACGMLVAAGLYQISGVKYWLIYVLFGMVLLLVSLRKPVQVYEINREIFCGSGKRILCFVLLMFILISGVPFTSYAAQKRNGNSIEINNFQDKLDVNDEHNRIQEKEQKLVYAFEDSKLAVTLYDEIGRKILIQDGAAWGIEQDIHLTIPIEQINEKEGIVMICYLDMESGVEKNYSFRCYKKESVD